jgi:hypothetical protein
MVQPRASDREFAEDRADRERVVPLGATRLAARRTSPRGQKKARHLRFDHDLLEAFEDPFALGKGQGQRLRFQIGSLQASDLTGLFAAVFAKGDHLNFADHGRTSRSWASARSWRLRAHRSNRSGWNAR